MKVKFLSSLSGINFSYNANDVEEFRTEEAKRLIAAGVAEEVKAPKKTTKKA